MQVKPSNRPFRTLQVQASGELSRVTVTEPSWRGNDVYWGHARTGLDSYPVESLRFNGH